MSSPNRRKKRKSSSSLPLIDQITLRIKNDGPLVCSFPGGVPVSADHIPRGKKNHSNNNISSDSDDDADDDSDSARLKFLWQGDTIMGKDEACVYTGTAASKPPRLKPSGKKGKSSHTPPTSSTSNNTAARTRLCVGVYDKQTGTLTVHPATVFPLDQHVPSYQSSTSNTELVTYASQYQALFQDFGSAKKLKVMRSQEANRVDDVSAVVGGGSLGRNGSVVAMDSMSESNRKALQERKALEQAAALEDDGNNDNKKNTTRLPQSHTAAVDASLDEYRRQFLPPYQLHATRPADVYRAADMAGPDVWGQLARTVTACWTQHGSSITDDGTTTTTVQALQSPPPPKKTGDETDDTKPPPRKDKWHPSVQAVLDGLDRAIQECQTSSSSSRKVVKLLQYKLQCAMLLNDWMSLYSTLKGKRWIAPPDPSKSRYFGRPMATAERFLTLFGTQVMGGGGGGQHGRNSNNNTDTDNAEIGYSMGKAKRDSCLVYMLLLYCTCHYNYGKADVIKAHNLKALADDLRVDTADCSRLLKEAGCSVVTSKQQSSRDTGGGAAVVVSAELKVPLTFPKHGTGGRGGGGRR